jgi:muramidase (phage lysozyme)
MVEGASLFHPTGDVRATLAPASQDKIALIKLKTRGALSDVESGKIETAIPKLKKEWTSLPGGTQSKMKIEDARKLFNQYLEKQ